MIIKCKAYPRAALIGNPSDGYFGKTIAFVFRNYCAEVELYESPELELIPTARDQTVFSGIEHLASDVSLYGYYGGMRLMVATVKKFNDYCKLSAIALDGRNFTIRYKTNIPNRLGLAGSSAIITATMRALIRFYGIKIPPQSLANLILAVEKDELGIQAGLQDRVAQAYNRPIFMDFNRDYMNANGFGIYTPIEIPAELNLYVAYRTDLAEGSEILHSRLREDYENGVPEVLSAIREWCELTEAVKEYLESRQYQYLPSYVNRNFDLRCEVCARSISPKNKNMVDIARKAGASAKFTGSGGAIIGTYEDEKMFEKIKKALKSFSVEVIKPEIVSSVNPMEA
ncbi:MAG: hypothetical protein PHS31_09565 [Victivallaceae bacterium]|nr:hypothetical protein [Victivallaceae bacterium]